MQFQSADSSPLAVRPNANSCASSCGARTGMAAGIDRMVMLLCGAQNLREITLFPMNQQAEDLLMGAPLAATPMRPASWPGVRCAKAMI